MGAGKLIQLVAVLVALVAGLIGGFAYSGIVIAILGIAGGMFVTKEDRMVFLVATIALIATGTQGSLGELPTAGEFVSGAVDSLAALFSAGAVVVILVGVWERLQPFN